MFIKTIFYIFDVIFILVGLYGVSCHYAVYKGSEGLGTSATDIKKFL